MQVEQKVKQDTVTLSEYRTSFRFNLSYREKPELLFCTGACYRFGLCFHFTPHLSQLSKGLQCMQQDNVTPFSDTIWICNITTHREHEDTSLLALQYLTDTFCLIILQCKKKCVYLYLVCVNILFQLCMWHMQLSVLFITHKCKNKALHTYTQTAVATVCCLYMYGSIGEDLGGCPWEQWREK